MNYPATRIRTFFFRILLLAFFFDMLSSTEGFSQQKEDVVFLLNGSILRGIVTVDSISATVRVLNHAGDIWVFRRNEVDSITREQPFEYKSILFNRKGFEAGMNADLLVRSGENAIGKAAVFGVNVGMGWRFNQVVSVGMESGIEFFDLMEVPVTAFIRLRPSNHLISPLVILSGGYVFPAERKLSDGQYDYKGRGGIQSSIGAGIEKIITENTSLVFSFTYHYQELNYHLTPLVQWVQERDRTETYSRFRFSIGYVFR